jgi:predicted metal-dependent phosphoesterase TrpH
MKMKNYIDLHMHSVYSDDGEFTPAELVQQCKEAGIKIMSIADHNSAKANVDAKIEAKKVGIQYITGIEIDCTYKGINLHLLGYGIDETAPIFADIEENIRAQEVKASLERLPLTRNLGFKIEESELNAIADINKREIWTGEVFAEVLLAKEEYLGNELLLPYRQRGSRGDNPYVNFYWDFYAQGKPCYATLAFPNLKEAIDIIHANGGKAILAHPGKNLQGQFELFDEMIPLGLDGVEAFCSYHSEETAKYFLERALQNDLFFTCGSDYHGKIKPSVTLTGHGCFIDSDEVMEQLDLN